MCYHLYERTGAVLILVLFILSLFSVLCLTLTELSTLNDVTCQSYIHSNYVYYRADGIMEQAYYIIRKLSGVREKNFKSQLDDAFDKLGNNESDPTQNEVAGVAYEIQSTGTDQVVRVLVSYTSKQQHKNIEAEFKVKEDQQTVEIISWKEID